MSSAGLPKIEFEGIKFNLNSILLMVGLAIGASAYVSRGDSKSEAITEANVRQDHAIAENRVSMNGAVAELRREMQALRAQDSSIAVLKNDVDSIKSAMSRIERKLEDKKPPF